MSVDNRYLSGDYLQATGGDWHLGDAPYKCRQVRRMLERHRIAPASVCELGCGAGGVLAELRKEMPAEVSFHGFDVSPQAYEMSKQFRAPNLEFTLGEGPDSGRVYDLVLVLDVIEHVEDPFAFLRKSKRLGEFKLYHIPLDISLSAVVRDSFLNAWKLVGHIHVFSPALALETLRSTGHEIVDYFYTPGALQLARAPLRTRVANLPRRVLPAKWAARLFGGFSLMVLTR